MALLNLKRPADYVAQQFKAVGLQPGGTSNEWFQPFELIAGLTVGSGNRLSRERQRTDCELRARA